MWSFVVYKTSAFWKALTRLPQSYSALRGQLAVYGLLTSTAPPQTLLPYRSPRVLSRVPIWPLPDIILLRCFFARINHPFIVPSHLHRPHYCNTGVRPLRNIRRPPAPPLVCHTPYNIGKTIACKGQHTPWLLPRPCWPRWSFCTTREELRVRLGVHP